MYIIKPIASEYRTVVNSTVSKCHGLIPSLCDST